MKDYFQTLAQYNQWANERLFKVCAILPANQYMAKRKAFFGSIHATLNHLLVVDRLWMGRIQQKDVGITALDQTLYHDFASLHEARGKEDFNLITMVLGLSHEQLAGEVTFKTLAGQDSSMSLIWLLSHLFNHQTHHRGQIHDMLSQTEISPPSLDIYYFLQRATLRF